MLTAESNQNEMARNSLKLGVIVISIALVSVQSLSVSRKVQSLFEEAATFAKSFYF